VNPLLATVTLTARGDAAPALVWDRYVDVDRWKQWSPQIQAVEAPSRKIVAGLEGTVLGPLGLRVPFWVTEVGLRCWTWEVRAPLGLRIVLRHRVVPDGDGSATELRMRGPVPLVLSYAPLAQLALRRLVSVSM
jgi:hypothetical protein